MIQMYLKFEQLTKFEIKLYLYWQILVCFDAHEIVICLDFGSENHGGIALISDAEMSPKCYKMYIYCNLCSYFQIFRATIIT